MTCARRIIQCALVVGALFGSIAVGWADVQVRQEWRRGTFGTGIGATGLFLTDLEGDGMMEIVASASVSGFAPNTYWYIVQHQNDIYDMIYVGPVYPASISALRVENVDGDGDLDIIIGTGDQILVYDGTTREQIRALTTGASSIRGLRTADIDSDGTLEFIFCDDDELFVHDVDSGLEEARIAGFGGIDLDVGNVDADDDMEIVIGNGSSAGYVLNGITRAIEWTYDAGFGDYVRLGDIDNDGRDELVAGRDWFQITAYRLDVVPGPMYHIEGNLNLDALQLVDIEDDGWIDIVYGDRQSGGVHAHWGITGVPKWYVDNPGNDGITDIAIGDSDGDGAKELIWGAGYASTGPDYLYVFSTDAGHAIEWQSFDISGAFFALDHGDTDNDGAPELLYGCWKSKQGYEDGLYFIHDATTYAQEYISPEPTGINFMGLWRVRQANVDADQQAEIIITTSDGYNGNLKCYDGVTHAEQWSRIIEAGLGFRSLEIADVDGDEQLEVIASVYRLGTGPSGTYLYVYDAATGSLEWQSESIGTLWAALDLLRIANIDGDDDLEMIVAETGGALWAFDGVTHEMQTQTADLDITSLDTADLNGDGLDEILIGTSGGAVQVIDPVTGAVSSTLGTFGAQVEGLRVADLVPGDPLELVYVANSVLTIRSIGELPVWTSQPLSSTAGSRDSIMVADIDEDGRTEIVVNMAVNGLIVYEVVVRRPGDMNCDAAINFDDVGPFVLALIDPDGYVQIYPNCDLTSGDLNQDATLDGTDVQYFADLLLN